MTLPFTPSEPPLPEPTIGEQVDIFLATQELLKFPKGSDIHARAEADLKWMRPALVVAMGAEGITSARTRIATATLDDDGELTVEKYEVAL